MVVGRQEGVAEDVLVRIHGPIKLALPFDRLGRRDLPEVPEKHEEAEEVVEKGELSPASALAASHNASAGSIDLPRAPGPPLPRARPPRRSPLECSR